MEVKVLSVASRAVLAACERMGLDGGVLLERAGLTRAEVEDPDARIDASRAEALWVSASACAGDPALALHAAEALPFGAYKVIDYLGAHSASVGDAVTRIAAYFPLVDPRAELAIVPGDPVELRMTMADGTRAVAPAGQEYTFAMLVMRLRAIAGGPWEVSGVDLTFDEPAHGEHARIFGPRVRFCCATPRLLFSEAAWRTPIRTADPALLALLDAHAARLVAELPERRGASARARVAVLDLLRERSEPTLEQVARRLGASARTLQRRLSEEEISFTALVDDARAALARAYLREPDLGLAEIAWLLGFADQSTFTRAFKRWTGHPPGAFRSA